MGGRGPNFRALQVISEARKKEKYIINSLPYSQMFWIRESESNSDHMKVLEHTQLMYGDKNQKSGFLWSWGVGLEDFF